MLLQMEYDEEKKAYQQMAEALGVERRVARGDAWFPLRIGRSYYNSLNQLCVEVFRQPTADDDDADDHNFEYGRPVQFFIVREKLRVKSEKSATAVPSGEGMAAANSSLFTLHSSPAPSATSMATAWWLPCPTALRWPIYR